MPDVPERANAIIIGGGIVGVSVAYHLAKRGMTDVLLLERYRLTAGTTWHAAGLVGEMRPTANLTEIQRYSRQLYEGLEAETGLATGFRRTGAITLAASDERWAELRRNASIGRGFGIDVQEIGPDDVRSFWPLADVSGVRGALYLPNDGQTNPVDTTMSLAKGARLHGVRIMEGVSTIRILTANGRAQGVETSLGTIRAPLVVLCAGLWSRDLAAAVGVVLPLHAAEHFYLVTEPMPQLSGSLPILRDPDNFSYFKEDAGKLLVGWFEPVAKPWGHGGIPADFAFGTLPVDFDHIEPLMSAAIARLPPLAEVGIRTFFNGPESFTPDDRYHLGETPEIGGLFVAAGFNSIGIQAGGGAGKVLADWIVDEKPPCDLWDVDVRRAQPFQMAPNYLRDRTRETLGLLYGMHWPDRQVETARGIRRSPLHSEMAVAGACFGELAGWERTNWFLPGEQPVERYAYDYEGQNAFDQIAAEHRAVREGVALFDQSSFAKFRVEGRDAAKALGRTCANDIDVPAGRIVYTQWLNAAGRIEADLTITRLSETAYLVVTAAATARRDGHWLKSGLGDQHAVATDVTSGMATLSIMGPRARQVMQTLTSADMSHSAFPFGESREIDIGYAMVRASRITYVGELGWELYIAAEFARHVYERIVEAGRDHDLRHAGYRALNSCRLEKGYRHWGHDITDEDTPLEAGLGFAIAWDKPGGFVGREALLAARAAGDPRKRLMGFSLSRPVAVYRNEPVFADGRLVGRVTSGAFGHHLGHPVALGYVADDGGVGRGWAAGRCFEIEIAGVRVPVNAQLKPFYDPSSERIRC